uniref:Ig-like domain-containing protein n=1 Tax=Cynoglossus semilaevis TaxID=244447 RepID=A0A3P8ULD0_CYNSE
SSSTTTQRHQVIKPVKYPSPSRPKAVEAQVTLEPRPPPFKDVRFQIQTDIEAGQASCRLTPIGDPNMVVEWLHDGKPLDAANRLRMVNEFGYCSLDYEVAYARDSGVVTCRATNKFGVDQTSATLIVKDEKVTGDDEVEKTKPEIVLLPEPTKVLEGDIARFRCRVTGYPAPKVNWYLNGQLIRKSKRYRLRYDGIYYLEIVDIKSYDSGEVRVVADNPLGTTEHTVKLEVQQKEDFRSVLRRAPEQKAAEPLHEPGKVGFDVTKVDKPIDAPQDREGSQWIKNGVELESSDKYEITTDGTVHSLKVKNCNTQDESVYSFKLGKLLANARLSVESEY